MTNKLAHYTLVDVVPALVKAGLPESAIEPFLAALNQADLTAATKAAGGNEKIVEIGIVTLTEAWAKTFKIGKFTMRTSFADCRPANRQIHCSMARHACIRSIGSHCVVVHFKH